MTLNVQMPKFLTAKSALDALWFCNQIICAEDAVDVQAESFKFIDPFGLALLGATMYRAQSAGRQVTFHGLSPELCSYLGRMGVIDYDGVKADRSDSLMELTCVALEADVEQAASRLATSVVGCMPDVDSNGEPDEMSGYTPFDRMVEPIQYALNELLMNALTHARRNGYTDAKVWVASQYFKKSGLVRLGVVDDGCGFLATLRGHPNLQHNSHLGAILTALKPRISCNRDLLVDGNNSVNQGVGLTTTLRIAEQASGRMLIVSGDAVYDSLEESLQAEHSWQGVAVALEFPRDRLPEIRFRELLPPLGDIPRVRVRFEQ